MQTYLVQIPIAGHLSFEIEAETPEDAITQAWDRDPAEGELSYETLQTFGRGNVSHCPAPWEVTAEEV